jgi:hypothetical protein
MLPASAMASPVAPITHYKICLRQFNRVNTSLNRDRLLTGVQRGKAPLTGVWGCPPILKLPQDWGIKGVEKRCRTPTQ